MLVSQNRAGVFYLLLFFYLGNSIIIKKIFFLFLAPVSKTNQTMTTSDGVTLRHPPIPMVDVHPRLDIDTISILSSQSDSVQHLSSYIESDDEGKGLVGSNSSRLHDAIAQSSFLTSSSSSHHQPSVFNKDWAMYITKTNNGSHNKHRHKNDSSSDDDESSSSMSDDDDDDGNEQDFVDDPWTIDTVQREYYTKQFKGIQPDITELISGKLF